jgi:hypothetical protein
VSGISACSYAKNLIYFPCESELFDVVCLQISVVSQELTLFNCTIVKNISYALKGYCNTC